MQLLLHKLLIFNVTFNNLNLSPRSNKNYTYAKFYENCAFQACSYVNWCELKKNIR